jgi:outer membrane receptor for ferrienterochelin and colicins
MLIKFKKMKNIYLLFILINSVTSPIFAQNLKGMVMSADGESLIGAIVRWKNTQTGVATDETGWFSIEKKETIDTLEVSYVGFVTKKIIVKPEVAEIHIPLNPDGILKETTVTARKQDSYVSTLSTKNVETITSNEIKKAACCNLSESFISSAAVDVSYTDAVTGAKEIQLLGLRGGYSQFLIENRPALTGLAAPRAFEYIPGSWLESIQIAKGTSTVMQGYQAISGQINAEIVKPDKDAPLFINLFSSTAGRNEANIHINRKISPNLSTGLLIHGNYTGLEIDTNHDGFLDNALRQQLNGLYRILYQGEKIVTQWNIHAFTDKIKAGQTTAHETELHTQNGNHSISHYGIRQDNSHAEVFGKVGYIGFDEPYRSLGSIWGGSWHRTDDVFGEKLHGGTQFSFYSNLIYATIINNTDHKINFGGGYQYDRIQENYNKTDLSRTESVTGVFSEYTYNWENYEEKGIYAFNFIAGLRMDYHNLYGLRITPRLNGKLNFTENSVFRFSAGRGYRTPNIIGDNIGMLATGRIFKINTDVQQESAWNYGVNYTQNFKIAQRDASISIDLYRTDFTNQLIADMFSSPTEARFYNLNGQSFANNFLVMLNWNFLRGWDTKLAYKYNDVQATYGSTLLQRPLTAKHRGLFTIDYTSPNKNWRVNTQAQFVGKQRLIPSHNSTDAAHHSDFSNPYALVNAQVTRVFGNLELYIGGENLTNYTIHNPIINVSDPFNTAFDASQMYAPMMGAMGFVGLRWKM